MYYLGPLHTQASRTFRPEAFPEDAPNGWSRRTAHDTAPTDWVQPSACSSFHGIDRRRHCSNFIVLRSNGWSVPCRSATHHPRLNRPEVHPPRAPGRDRVSGARAARVHPPTRFAARAPTPAPPRQDSPRGHCPRAGPGSLAAHGKQVRLEGVHHARISHLRQTFTMGALAKLIILSACATTA